MVKSLRERILGHPFVYERIRPLVVGGIDYGPLYRLLDADRDSVVLDVGCGTGDALRHLTTFAHYRGVDLDPVAIAFARKRYGARANVSFAVQHLGADDVLALDPTHVCLVGVLHHLADDEALALLASIARAPRIVRVVSADITWLPGKIYNNVLSTLDRGQHCRTPQGYAELVRRAKYVVEHEALVPAAPGNTRVRYWNMAFAPARVSVRPAARAAP